MEKNASPERSLAPEPEQGQDHMDSCSQGVGEGESEQKQQLHSESENVAKEMLEEPEKSSKANSEIKKTWGFRRSTVEKREMPVEAATDATENRCPVRRSGRQSKRTDKLEEFLSTAKRGTRKSAPPSLESGDPPSQTPTDAETASEASFDGSADAKTVEDRESPERRTRSGTRKQMQQKTSARQTRRRGRVTVKDEGSSDNEEDARAADKKDHSMEESDEKSLEDVGGSKAEQSQQELDPEKAGVDEQRNEHGDNDATMDTEQESDNESEKDSADKPTAMLVKRGPIRTYANKKKAANKNTTPVKAPPNKSVTLVQRDTKPTASQVSGKTQKPQTEEDNDGDDDEDDDDDEEDDDDDSLTSSSSSSFESDDGGYDPNALYCICRQKHNKRFMICCDRCEEWFHGDCVGITEARGRLMERNGEDYICPNCTTKKNQVVKPATSVLTTNAENGKLKANVAPPTSALAVTEKSGATGLDPSQSAGQAVALPQSSPSAGNEEKPVEDQGIKGRIEKATNPTGKKKIKIFQPALQQPAEPKADLKPAQTAEKKTAPAAEQKALPDTEQKVASNVEVKTTPTAEVPEAKAGQKEVDEATLPKCIGPGCENNAQPDSVYCGKDCILRHAAATMKSITDVKEPKQRDKTLNTKSTLKRSSASGKKTRKTSREDSDSEEDYSPDPDEDDEDEHAVEQPPPPTTASWSSDHNYIAVTPEKTTPISPTVLNKKCMYLFEDLGPLLKPRCCFSLISVFHVMLT